MSDRAPHPPASSVVRWQPSLARDRRRARHRLVLAGIGVGLIGLAAVVDLAVRPAPRLVWNPSASAPVRVGDMVLASTPVAVRRMAAARRYPPMNVPLLKRVVAADGDRVCAFGRWIFVDGRRVAQRREADRRGRPLPWWHGCRTLQDGAVLLLMEAPESFDGRYFGPVPRSALIGKATPLWVR